MISMIVSILVGGVIGTACGVGLFVWIVRKIERRELR